MKSRERVERQDTPRRSSLVYLLFFFSGSAGLMYQVLWARQLQQIMGATVYAASAVIAAYMAGMALGSVSLGRLADRKMNPLLLFGLFELLIGLTALAVPVLIDKTASIFLHYYAPTRSASAPLMLLRFLLSILCLVVPTSLMGATMPVLAKWAANLGGEVKGRISGLYAANVAGAVAGVIASGFLLIRYLGTKSTGYVASAAAAGVGLAVLLLFIKSPNRNTYGTPKRVVADVPEVKEKNGESLAPLFMIGISGAIAIGYEILWMRSLSVVLGNSTYAFSTMLATVLLGLALGSAFVKNQGHRILNAIKSFGYVQIFIGISTVSLFAVSSILLFTSSIQAFFARATQDQLTLHVLQFAVAAAGMLIPSTLIGMTFPLIAERAISRTNTPGAATGRILAANTVGNVLGSIFVPILLLPLIGITKGVMVLSFGNIAVGAAILLKEKQSTADTATFVFASVSAIVLLLTMSFAEQFQFPSDTQGAGDAVLFYREGVSATTKVYEKQESFEKHMSVDGIYIGGSGGTEQKEFILAHLPKLLIDEFNSELSIGLGSGILLGESARHDTLQTITCVEIAESVVQGAEYFSREHRDVFSDPRVKVIVEDGLVFLRGDRDVYSIISTDAKSRPKAQSNGLFYSRDYYLLLRDHIADSGLTIQWIPLHLPPNVYRQVLGTFVDVFPYVSLWFFADTDTFIVGSKEKITLDGSAITRRWETEPDSFAGLRRYGITEPSSLPGNLIAQESEIRRTIGDIPSNTLERPVIEFYSVNDYVMSVNDMVSINLEFLRGLRGKRDDETDYKLQALKEAYGLSTDFERIRDLFARSIGDAKDSGRDRFVAARYHIVRARALINEGDYRPALKEAQMASSIYPEGAEVWYLLSFVSSALGESALAVEYAEKAVAMEDTLYVRRTLFFLYLQQDELEKSIEQLERMLDIDPDAVFALRNIGLYHAEKRQDYNTALSLFRRLVAVQRHDPEAIGLLAWYTYLSGYISDAREIVRTNGRYFWGNRELRLQRRIILRSGT